MDLHGPCSCGWDDCPHFVFGYPHCLLCGDHHREWPDCPGDLTPAEMAAWTRARGDADMAEERAWAWMAQSTG